MLRTRLWMVAVLIGLTLGVLVVDQHLKPWFPFLFFLVQALALVACFELLHLLPAARCPPGWLCYTAVAPLLTVTWVPRLWPFAQALDPDPWHWVLGVLTGVVLAAFLVEMAIFREPGASLGRI